MPNLKDLDNRIKSVKSTRKITSAMKMVSAAKLRSQRERAEQSAPYAERIDAIVRTLADSATTSDSAPKLLVGNGNERDYLLILATADRGLCGGFNSSLVKEVKHKIHALEREGKKVKVLCVGKKGHEQLYTHHKNYITGDMIPVGKVPTYESAASIARQISAMFEEGEFGRCLIFFNKFESAISQIPTEHQLIPADTSKKDDASDKGDALPMYEFEPSEEEILHHILPQNLAMQIYHALLENAASEQGARMTAMDNATRNAGEMIQKLTLVYNRTRQAGITRELIEIISGAEAL